MLETIQIWSVYLVCAATIGAAGLYLTRFGHIIAEKTGLGGSVIGFAMLATVTSLPELATGVSAVAIVDAPNIAVGDALGSCVFNLLMIMFLELSYPQASIYTRVTQGHILSAAFGVVIIGFATLGIIAGATDRSIPIAHIGFETPILIALYGFGIYTITHYERAVAAKGHSEAAVQYQDISLGRAVGGYSLAALVVIIAGTAMPYIAEHLAVVMNWNRSFVGTSLVALSTSLPEAAVVVAAARLGALDMAVANLLGSNLFDALILAIDDIAYTKGPLLAEVADVHAATGVSAMIMTGGVISALFLRPADRPLRWVGWTGIFLLSVYAMNVYFIYVYGA